ncbi:RraA family protein [Pigmentiphaga sp. GD03639]|jgi:4-hydroxy-4-methyl-2-oxoglutarate aldolase|uniref:RraA family protein n=1 Tax=Pigmentiphaga sp. GD03639 TaxID=2975354 RepID=UPI00244CE9F8|nr:RraA family protein [Pigmentiphaga sp. GD03639]MDH2238085.1 RraA family protein [Pigmentiphaga sp. GD03639]
MTISPDTDAVVALCALLRQASAAAAYEAMERGGHMSPTLSALVAGVLCTGPAYTVRAPAGYGDEIVRAADEAPPGSVIVIDVGPAPDACTWGGTGTAVAQRRGVSGVVSNGRVRDLAEIRRARFPVFARGAVATGWSGGRRGETGVPVSVGGRVVQAGDVLCADDDGIVVIPRAGAAPFLERLRARLDFEREAARIVDEGGRYADVMARKPA